jgi:hypothetical protein
MMQKLLFLCLVDTPHLCKIAHILKYFRTHVLHRVNAMTFLVAICLLPKCDDIKARLNRIFDLFDFDKLKQVNIDELV